VEAERIADRLARAILSCRRMPARRGETIDLRRTIRRNLSRGGEPIELRRKHRPERPVKLVVLVDCWWTHQDRWRSTAGTSSASCAA
jgi:uncharacterized protein with von Willebrand factor type A (vWA) domain